MAFEDLLHTRDDWFLQPGPLWEVAVSSRLRLARNLEGRRFPNHAGAQEQAEVVQAFETAFGGLVGGPWRFVRLKDMRSLDRQFLTERQLISAELAAGLGERAAAFHPAEGLGALVNEEDHLRLQVFQSGLSLQTALVRLRSLEEPLAKAFRFAYDPVLGFLTACPTNLGWGLRASVMLHLPALVYTNQILKVLEGVSQVGLVVRGLQGESTQVSSAFFQVSNQSSLGKRPLEIVEHVERVTRQLVEVEWQARKTIFSREGLAAQDRICRTLGVLKSAKLLSLEEALDSLSILRVGVEGKLVRNLTLADLNRLRMTVQPAHLAKAA
ncbi:MAG: ATP--guanido phosphotransferase, partial [Desulfobaccales bacterium]